MDYVSQAERKSEDRRAKNDNTKKRLKQLFLNYCDFSMDTGTLFITFTNFCKLLKDAGVKEDANRLSLVVSSECMVTNNLKTILFDKFLNCLLRVSEI
jgi:hypothetical protein